VADAARTADQGGNSCQAEVPCKPPLTMAGSHPAWEDVMAPNDPRSHTRTSAASPKGFRPSVHRWTDRAMRPMETLARTPPSRGDPRAAIDGSALRRLILCSNLCQIDSGIECSVARVPAASRLRDSRSKNRPHTSATNRGTPACAASYALAPHVHQAHLPTAGAAQSRARARAAHTHR